MVSGKVDLWTGSAALALAGSLLVGRLLPAAAFATAPDGSGRSPGMLIGPSCERSPAGQARIASASLITDEILLELLPLGRWEAVSYVVDWPRVSPVSRRFDPRLVRTSGTAEHLLGLRADRILISEHNASMPLPQLVSAGRCVAHVAAPRTVAELFDTIAWVGTVTGTGQRAADLVHGLRIEVEGWTRDEPESPLRALALQGLMVYGPDTLQGDCLSRAGFHNAALDLGIEGTPTLGAEILLGLDLDVLFVAAPVDQPGPASRSVLLPGVLWKETKVARRGHLIAVPETWVGSLSHHALHAGAAYAAARKHLELSRRKAGR